MWLSKEKYHDSFLLSIVFCMLFMVSCSNEPDTKITQFVEEVKARQSVLIEPLPEFLVDQPFHYPSKNLKNPFEPVNAANVKPAIKQQGPSPDLNRPKEPLESFPLDSLKMVGTLERSGAIHALIKDSQGLIYRVNKGNYIGQNFGYIEKISQTGLDIQEWVLNSKGEWQMRNTVLHFSQDKQNK